MLGVPAILAQNPYEVPTRRTKKSPAPLFHVHGVEARRDLWRELGEFLGIYRDAVESTTQSTLIVVPVDPNQVVGTNHRIHTLKNR